MLAIPVANPKSFLADKGYDGDSVREELLIHGIRSVIRLKQTGKTSRDSKACKNRNCIERMFNRPKPFRKIATRYYKNARSYSALLNLATAKLWLQSLVDRQKLLALSEPAGIVPTSMWIQMTLKNRLNRIYYNIRFTSAYTGRFIFHMIRVGILKFLLLFFLVRVYCIPLASYSALARDLAITSAVGLGIYLYRGLHSYEDVKKAVHACDHSIARS